MYEKLESIYEYRMLFAMQEHLGIPLSAREQQRLQILGKQLSNTVPKLDENDNKTVLETPLYAQYTTAGGFGSGLVRNISGGGMAILSVDLPPLNQRLIVHVMEPKHGIEYIFPCKVMSRTMKGLTSISIAFDGTPSQLRMGSAGSGVWCTDFNGENCPELENKPKIA